MSRNNKLANLMNVVTGHLDARRYLDTRHARERQTTRSIARPEILHVLRSGYHEKRKDRFDELHQAWNYAVRGRTVDRRDLRIIISFDENDMLIITAIELKL